MNVSSAIKDLVKGMLANVHTCMPGRIETYDYTLQKATVKPLLKRTYVDGSVSSYPVITEVPVIFPRSGEASLTFPIVPGDFVLLLFSERTMDLWLQKGTESPSLVERQFSLNDAIAIPGLLPFNTPSYAENNTHVTLHFKDFKIAIDPTGHIAIGQGTNELLKILSDLIQALTTAVTATAIGPQPLSIAATTLPALKVQIEAIRGTL